MHPALSIIVFTTVSGVGYGLAALIGLGLLDPAAIATKVGHVAALGLIATGLLASTLHLGNPQRAWRAFSQWRTSWLSREGVMAVVTFLPLCASAYLSIFESRQIMWLGIVGAGLSAVTVYCTSMIYASLKSIDAWHTRWTPACYLAFAAACGATAGSLLALAAGNGLARTLALVAAALVALAWLVKAMWRRRLHDFPLSTAETATGLGHLGRVRMIEAPHAMDNYLTREMGFRVARKHAAKLAVLSLGSGLMATVLLLAAALLPGPVFAAATAGLALLALLTGILVERWLFFAEARHSVMSFYGR